MTSVNKTALVITLTVLVIVIALPIFLIFYIPEPKAQEATVTKPISLQPLPWMPKDTLSRTKSPQGQPPQQQTAPQTPQPPMTELIKNDTVEGTGAIASTGDTVTVNYVGALTNGTVFDASAKHGDTGFTFTLGGGQVIQGWEQGVIGMKEGGKRVLGIPAELAYGAQAMGDAIPPNSDLLFEIELLKVEKTMEAETESTPPIPTP